MQQITELQKNRLDIEREKIIKEMPALSKKLAEAAALGDMRENSEYDALKQEISLKQVRLSEIDRALTDSEVVSFSDDDRLTVGSLIDLTRIYPDGTQGETTLFLLDSVENFLKGVIGINSPLGRAINGNPEGIYEIQTPSSTRVKYKVIKKSPSQELLKKFMELYPDDQQYFK